MKLLSLVLALALAPFALLSCGSGSGSGSQGPPSGLTYAENPATYVQGFAATPNVPSVSGTVVSWSIAPALPTGMSMDASGTILGTPIVTLDATDFVVTATNVNGSSQTTVNIEVLAPMPRALYIANLTDGTVGSFHVGGLIHSGYALSGGSSPRALAARSDGAYVYAANNAASTISAFTADALTGRLTVAGSAVASGSLPTALATDPTGSFLFSANLGDNTISTFTIDAGVPVAASSVSTGSGPSTLAVGPTGDVLYVANVTSDDVERFSIDPGTGALTSGGTIAAAGAPRGFAIATTPAGSFLYAANSTGGTISQWSIAPSTGALTALVPATVAAGTDPRALAAHPDGTFLYCANRGDDTLGMYAIDQGTGALTPLGTPTIGTGTGPTALAIQPDGSALYVCTEFDREVSEYAIGGAGLLTHTVSVRTRGNPTDLLLGPAEMPFQVSSDHLYGAAPGTPPTTGGNVGQFSTDTTLGKLTALSPASVATVGTAPAGVALHPDGALVLASSETGGAVTLFTRDAATGLLTQVGAESVSNTSDIAFDPTGRFAYVNRRLVGVQPFSVDTATPDLTPLTLATFGTDPRRLDVDPTGQFLYLADTGTGVFMFRITATTGELVSLGSVAGDGGTSDVVVHPSGRWAYASNTTGDSVSMFSIDETTGSLVGLVPPTVSTGGATDPIAVEISQDGNDMYVTLLATNEVAHLSIDQATGLLTYVSALGTFSVGPRTLVLDATDRLLTVGNTGSAGALSLFLRNPTTGALTASGFSTTDGGPTALAVSFDIE